ncbi:uncharacterized protein LOC113201735 [Frankliniella occidentalis]|uniref:Uncharacterized protein LOC113201735 n=1 Tax=Frankliniella occidentalis TaxID=133901 RepID=A0A6J1RQM8_FRAOC|nr:uncharacterized protein LOC113201735 [Frankliniella occidentalis]
MERALGYRRREIECELLQLEADVWKDLNMEQQILVEAEEHKLEQLTEAVIKARSAFHQKVFESVNRVESPRPSLRTETKSTAGKSQQTERMTIEGEIISGEELDALRKEVTLLEEAARLLDQHKRLADEPLEGDAFKRLQAALSVEEDRSVELQRQISELEDAVQEAQRERDQRSRVEGDMPLPFSWIEDPWDQEPEEAASAVARKEVQQPNDDPDRSHSATHSQKGGTRLVPLSGTLHAPVGAQGPRRDCKVPPRAPAQAAPQARSQGAIASGLGARSTEAGEEETRANQGPDAHSTPAQVRFVPKKAFLFKKQ